MNVVDSSGWLEYFADGNNADFFAPAIEKTSELVVPVISLYEVYKRILQQRGETAALQAVAHMHQGEVVELDSSLAISAARLSVHHRLPMADSIIMATAQRHKAFLWTQDNDFEGLDGVRYQSKGRAI
jgi:toxin FitB